MKDEPLLMGLYRASIYSTTTKDIEKFKTKSTYLAI